MDPSYRALVGGLAPLQNLTPPALDALLADATWQRLEEGEEVFGQGEPALYFYMLVQGRAKVVQTTPEGQQVVLVIVGPGEFFGLAAGIGRTTYPGTATAVMPGAALSWPSAIWERLVSIHPDIARDAMLTMGRRLQEMQARLREMSTERVERRIAHAILRLVRQSGRKVDAGVMIEFPISRQDIAEMTGTTLHTVSRTLSAWEQSGILVGVRRRIIVRDAHALVRIAGD
ncbi:MAG: Crp/Fnr family transcriptional regulator [Acetobacteraceae bacterium]|nr:Crp/Fnr family transcriptional regulator [Acetobacteraceae bacterium]